MRECRNLKDMFVAYVYGDLPADDMRVVRLHAELCDDCRREIAALKRTLSLIPADVPDLTDEERLRIMWSVKGAVKAGRKAEVRSTLAGKLIWGFAGASLIVAVFLGGASLGRWLAPPKVKQMTKYVPAKQKPESQTPTSVEVPTFVEQPTHVGPPIIPILMASEPPRRDWPQPVFRGNERERMSGEDEQLILSPNSANENLQIIPDLTLPLLTHEPTIDESKHIAEPSIVEPSE